MSAIVFLGDVFLPKPVDVRVKGLNNLVVNFESPITSSCIGIPDKINLKVKDNYLQDSFGEVPITVCLANNHMLDYGEQGFNDTIHNLSVAGIGYFGAGSINNNCNNPYFITVDGVCIGLIGYACYSTNAVFTDGEQTGVNPVVLESIVNDIAIARSQGADRIVVSLHWGAEEVFLPKPDDIRIAHEIIDAGADMIVGHHSHCIQAYELYNEKYIFYGLGNCIFPYEHIPCDFDDHGVPKKSFNRKQSIWNRRSLAVRYEPTGSVTVSMLVFDGKKLVMLKNDTSCYRRDFGDMADYHRVYKRSYRIGIARAALASYLLRPKLPGVRHIRAMLNLFRAKS